MKKKLLTLGIVGLLAGFSGTVSAQDSVEKKITDDNGNISLVVFKKTSNYNASSANQLFKDLLKLSSNDELKLVKSEMDFSGKFLDEKYQLLHKGIKVEGGVYNLHYQNQSLRSMNGEIFQDDTAESSPRISSSNAFNIAVGSVKAQKYMWEDAEYIANNDYKKPLGELLYLPVYQGEGKYSLILAYRFDIYAAQPISRSNIYVDAIEGRIIAVDAIMKHAENQNQQQKSNPISVKPFAESNSQSPILVAGNAETRYSGNQTIETTLSGSNYILSDTSRGNGIRTYNLKKGTSFGNAVDFTDANNNWTAAEFDNSTYDNAALDAHWGVEKTYDYFKDTFNRNSYDGNGTLLKSYVHYSSSYDNAGWTGSEMIYGDGATSFKPLTAFDVTAHELGHGVCSSSAALVYQRESGALNEALSDIWGASAEYTYAPNKQTWLIGEDITKVSPYYLRSMSNPKSGLSAQPDTYHGTNWYPATVEEGCVTPGSTTNDNCGVHYNSGVINHWYYILSVGKTGVNDLGKSYSVTGITIDKAEKIVYRLETAYLTSTSNFMNARNFGIQAAQDLYGANSPEAIATQDAFYAVGLGGKYLATPDTTPPTTPTSLVATNTTGSQTKLTWNASTDDNDLDGYILYKDGTQLTTIAANVTTYTVTGLTPNTTYQFYVKAKDAYNNISSQSNVASVTTLNTPVYCTATSSNTTDERIKRVQFLNIDNPSTGTAGYEDFSYISTDVTKGVANTITITPQWGSTAYSEAYGVFVDLNNDGDFSDTGETVFTKTGTTTTPVTGSITIPTSATGTTVRMRVIMRYSIVPTGCASFTYGQVEDYTLNLKEPALAVADVNSSNKTVIYPNPVKDIISIQGKTSGEFSYRIFNAAGQIILAGKSSDKKINAEKLTSGNYLIELKDKDGTTSTMKFIKK